MPSITNTTLSLTLTGGLEALTKPLSIVLVTSDYTFSPAHTTLANIPAGSRVAIKELSDVSVTDNTINSSPVVFPALVGPTAIGCCLISGGGTTPAETSPLYSYHTFTPTIIPNGGDVTITFPNGYITASEKE